MKKRIGLYFLIILLLVGAGVFLWLTMSPKEVPLRYRQVPFSQLPGWDAVDVKKSLAAFQLSCRAFLKQNPDKFVGSDVFDVTVKDWHPACRAIASLSSSNEDIKAFFQTWFVPVEFFQKKPVSGLFTGYYMPLLQGSLTPTKKYHVPLYGMPRNLIRIPLGLFDPKLKNRTFFGRVVGHRMVPFYTREEINHGAIRNVAPVIVWLDNYVDRSFLEIQGSGLVQLRDGSLLAVGYEAQNGAAYTAIAKVLIDKGVMTRDNASMQRIRSYLALHPDELHSVLNQNKSFIFFSLLAKNAALGSQGVALTPGYSLAVDRQWVPLGTPIWLNTTRPYQHTDRQKPFQRLMIAQDTGGAIKGVVRGDVYWGAGEQATAIAGRMKNPGHYWLLLPRSVLERYKI